MNEDVFRLATILSTRNDYTIRQLNRSPVKTLKYGSLPYYFLSSLSNRALITNTHYISTKFPYTKSSLLILHNWLPQYPFLEDSLASVAITLESRNFLDKAWALLSFDHTRVRQPYYTERFPDFRARVKDAFYHVHNDSSDLDDIAVQASAFYNACIE